MVLIRVIQLPQALSQPWLWIYATESKFPKQMTLTFLLLKKPWTASHKLGYQANSWLTCYLYWNTCQVGCLVLVSSGKQPDGDKLAQKWQKNLSNTWRKISLSPFCLIWSWLPLNQGHPSAFWNRTTFNRRNISRFAAPHRWQTARRRGNNSEKRRRFSLCG